ncbi:hypothetical protein M569_06830 [Genlisea aurea]|uniref:Crossover junction endonuclease MUS81 n=1 Tax=Genlisea aurea TaxID=192259 RepID=S8DXE1_9LAMI|nr:hypothetical protein M569_06830 [Genlisea aurea]
MDPRSKAACAENEEVAAFLWKKWQEMAQSAKGISENVDRAWSKAYSNVCCCKSPIRTLRDLFQIQGTEKGDEFMHKRELIDAAEISGLSRVPIMPEKGKGKAGHFESSSKDWYTGWSCMKTLISKGLVVKSSCPAKYMLTEEGKKVASECLMRSGLIIRDAPFNSGICCSAIEQEEDLRMGTQEDSTDVEFVDSDLVENEVAKSFPGQSVCSSSGQHPTAAATTKKFSQTHDVGPSYWSLKACSSRDNAFSSPGCGSSEYKTNALAMPPLTPGEKFSDIYGVILILDDREQFATQGSRSRKIMESICSQFKIQIEVRRLPVGDGIWIARHKYSGTEYVLDFIVERKKVGDLRHSIKDNRYREQKMRLQRCGLKKLIYLVEGDPNSSEAAESVKTACFTTEVLEGFDVQRTNGLGDTLKKYGYLTQSIKLYYSRAKPTTSICHSFADFIKRCMELDSMTVSDVFALQLMQVPQVTEDVAGAVLEMYPTVFSLGCAYSVLDGDVGAQEEMLRKQSNGLINGSASRNIFRFVWGTTKGMPLFHPSFTAASSASAICYLLSNLSIRASATMIRASSSSDDVFSAKKALRSKIRKELKSMDPALRIYDAIQNLVLEAPWFKSCRRLCAYVGCAALREVDTCKLLSEVLLKEACRDDDPQVRRKKLYVPRVEDRKSFMRMLNITRMDDLIKNSMDILEPAPIDRDGNELEDVFATNAAVMVADEPVDLVLLPGLAFDKSGRRLGRGGGYYDAFLTRYGELVKDRNWKKKPLLVGLAYSVQMVEDGVIPVAGNDVPVDALVTSAGIIHITPADNE